MPSTATHRITGTATGTGTGEQGDVTWRQLNPHLWVGHAGTGAIGTIEHGSRYVYVGPDGEPQLRAGTLREAQDAATGPITLPVAAMPPTSRLRRGWIVWGSTAAAFALIVVVYFAVGRMLLLV